MMTTNTDEELKEIIDELKDNKELEKALETYPTIMLIQINILSKKIIKRRLNERFGINSNEQNKED